MGGFYDIYEDDVRISVVDANSAKPNFAIGSHRFEFVKHWRTKDLLLIWEDSIIGRSRGKRRGRRFAVSTERNTVVVTAISFFRRHWVVRDGEEICGCVSRHPAEMSGWFASRVPVWQRIFLIWIVWRQWNEKLR